MLHVTTWRTQSHFRTDCLSCACECPAPDADDGAHRRWARRHAEKNPGHRVAVELTFDRIYEADA